MGQNRTFGRRGFKSLPDHGGQVKDANAGGNALTVRIRILLGLLSVAVLVGCNPIYVIRLGWAESRILRSRVPLTEVMVDPSTDEGTRGKLRLVWDAREYAISRLGFQNAGNSYTSLARLESDTLALVLTAAYPDRLAFRTWWFPIAGRIPYRAYFSIEGGERARDEMEEEGFDTYLRPTAAFSTLGWFADPLYSTMLRSDTVELVQTVLHELAHNHLYVPGQGRFNESFTNFVGHVAAIHFFCRSVNAGPVTVRCQRARDRWADAQEISRFIDALEADVAYLLDQPEGRSPEELLTARNALYRAAREDFLQRVQPSLQASTYAYLASEPLNNATLLSRSLYHHRLPEFNQLWRDWSGELSDLLAWLESRAPDLDDPFQVLEAGVSPEGR